MITLLIVFSSVDKLIMTARSKLSVLCQAVSKIEITPEIRARANIFYHNIVARFMRENYREEVAAEGGRSTRHSGTRRTRSMEQYAARTGRDPRAPGIDSVSPVIHTRLNRKDHTTVQLLFLFYFLV